MFKNIFKTKRYEFVWAGLLRLHVMHASWSARVVYFKKISEIAPKSPSNVQFGYRGLVAMFQASITEYHWEYKRPQEFIL